MKKLLALLVCFAGLLTCVSSAHASYDYNVFASPNSSSATGIWKVVFSTSDYQLWNVTVTPFSGPPNGSVNAISLSFVDGNGVLINDGGTGTSATVASSDYGHTDRPPFSPWGNTPPSEGITYNAPNAASNLMPSGGSGSGSTFTAQFRLASAMKAGTLNASLSNNGGQRQWFGSTSYTPEMPGAALLLPALLPVGMVLRGKKRGVRNMFRSSTTV